jgi:5'-3' exonuclease
VTTLIIDGNNLAMTSIFAMRRSGLSAHGISTGPLLAMINKLAAVIGQEHPDRVVLCWDGGRSKRRTDLYPPYKSNRTPVTDSEKEFRESSFDLIKQFCTLANVPQFRLDGTEADDLIAAAWDSVTDVIEQQKIVIVSSDKDFLQLLGTNQHGIVTEQVRLDPKDARWTAERVIGEMGYTPEQVPLVMALTGDAIDAVPGLRGVGPKKAVKMLKAHDWDLDTVIREKANESPTDAVLIRVSYQLVDLRHPEFPVAVPEWRPTTPDSIGWDLLDEFLTRWELRSVQEKLRSGALWLPSTASNGPAGRPFRPRSGA